MNAYRSVVALGSSFAAGPGIEPIVDRAAMRSGRNYAQLLSTRLGAHLTDLTVSGATTATIVSQPQSGRRNTRFAPQVEGIPPDADLITVTAGGNDLGYAAGLIAVSRAGRLRQRALTRRLGGMRAGNARPVVTDADVERATAGLAQIVQVARHRAPDARIVLVDYLTVLGAQTVPGRTAPLTVDEIATFIGIAERLAGAFSAAARRSGAELVAASTLSRDHAVGSAEPWVFGYSRQRRAAPFHPNAQGMQAVADAIYQQVRAGQPPARRR